MATRDERYRQAAWTYVVYGVVYWLGGLVLATAGLGPRGMERGRGGVVRRRRAVRVGHSVAPRAGARVVRPLGPVARDFARVLTLLVVIRAVEVGRIAWRSGALTVVALGVEVPMQRGRRGSSAS